MVGRFLGFTLLAGALFILGAIARPTMGSAVAIVRTVLSAAVPSKTVVVRDATGEGFQRARFVASEAPAPLVVDLHEWSQDEQGSFGGDNPMIDEAARLGWNYIRPALSGPNNSPDACCSQIVLDRIKSAIAFAKENGSVDPNQVYIVGASGGGYTGLCALMSGEIDAAGWSIWVPISDLAAWQRFQKDEQYGRDVMACTRSGTSLNVAEAQSRSPLYMSSPPGLSDQYVSIYAGIDDGWNGSVPISHSIRMFNRLAVEVGHLDAVIDQPTAAALLEKQYDQTLPISLSGGRQVVYAREAGRIRLTIFDGAHEGITSQALADFSAH